MIHFLTRAAACTNESSTLSTSAADHEKCVAYEASARNRDVVPCCLDTEANTYVSADLLTGQFYGGGTLSGGLCQVAGYQDTVFQRSPGDKPSERY